jgi:hypothetical protein
MELGAMFWSPSRQGSDQSAFPADVCVISALGMKEMPRIFLAEADVLFVRMS